MSRTHAWEIGLLKISVQTTDICTDYRHLYRLQTSVQTTDICTDYRHLHRLQTSVQTTDICTDYRHLNRLQTSVQTTDICTDYRHLYVKHSTLSQILSDFSPYSILFVSIHYMHVLLL